MAALSAALLFCCSAVLSLPGCEEPPPPPPPPPPPRPAPPPPPEPVDAEAMVQEMGVDARVRFPNEVAPVSDVLARGIIRFADTLAKGDANQMRRMLDDTGRRVLDELLSTGGWDEGTANIEAVVIGDVQSGDETMPTAEFTTVIQEPGSAYVLRWAAIPDRNDYIYSPLESSPQVRARADDFIGFSSVPAARAPSEAPGDEDEPAEAPPPEPSGGDSAPASVGG